MLALLAAAGLYLVFLGLGLPLKPLAWAGRKRLLFPGFALVLMALEIGFVWLVVTKAPSPLQAFRQIYRSAMAQAAANIMRSKTPLPQKVDNQITFIAISAVDDRIINEFAVRTESSAEFHESMGLLETGLQRQSCQRADYRELMKNGLSVELRFHEIGTPYVAKLLFTPRDCGF